MNIPIQLLYNFTLFTPFLMSPAIQPYNYSLKMYVKDIGMPHLTIVYPFACEFSTVELLPYQTTTT